MLRRPVLVILVGCFAFFMLAVLHPRTDSSAQSAALFSFHKKTKPQAWQYRAGRVVIKFKPAIKNFSRDQRVAALAQTHAIGALRPLFYQTKDKALAASTQLGLDRIVIATVPEQTDIAALALALQNDPSVEYAEPDYLMPFFMNRPLRGARGVSSAMQGQALSLNESGSRINTPLTPLKGGIHDESQVTTPALFFPQEGNIITPNDSLFPQQQYLTQVKAEQAWDTARGDSSVIIAIIDSGTEWQHPDLGTNIWKNVDEAIDGVDNDNNGFVDDVRGWDFVDDITDAMQGEDNDTPDNDPSDFVSHGTGVSGVAAAVTNNTRGVASLSWNVQLMPLRVGWMRNDFESVVSTAFSAAAFVYAADNGAHVANLSAGSSRVVADAAQYAFQKGVVIVGAAGNIGGEEAFGLNLAPFTITVAAVNDRDEMASYSSFGDWVKVSAPGGDLKRRHPGILTTTLRGAYREEQGTSFASPLVASLAALVKSKQPQWSAAQITFQVVETADPIDVLNPDFLRGKLGRGRINAQRALTETVTPLPEILLGKIYVNDNGNQVLDAGETAELRIDLQNVWGDAVNLQAQLSTEDYAINLIKPTASYGTLPGLSDLSLNVQNNANDPFIINAHAEALPHRARFRLALSAANGYEKSFEFYLALSPFVLLVDDDHGQNNVEHFYSQTLDSLGIAFDTYAHPREESAQLDMLARYANVIWACEWAFPTLDEVDRNALAQYLNNGGKLFISGQDIGWDLSDATPNLFNQFQLSRGTSRQFYENFLHTRYLSDDANLATLTGAVNDPIGHGLSFNIEQPGRTISEQLPSEIAALAPATSIFNYANGRSGAVRYEGNHRVVYFGFGGFEAIVQAPQRHEVMKRVLYWLNGFSIEHTPLRDTDDTTRAQVVEAQINSSNPLTSVALYWDIDGKLPFNKVAMTEQGGGVYRGEIPPQFNRIVEYFIHARNAQGFASPLQKYFYSTHPDTIAPAITSVTSLPNSLSNVGPFTINVQASDVNGIDTSAAWLHFRGVYTPRDSVRLRATSTANLFMGELRGPFHLGDTLRYYASVRDSALRRNRTISPEKSFVIGHDGFENGLHDWRVDSLGWGTTSVRKFFGTFGANSNPGRVYANKTNTALTLAKPLDFSKIKSETFITLSFYEQHFFAASQEDFGVVETSRDAGQSWQALSEPFRSTSTQWQRKAYDLTSYRGLGYDDVRIRFRAQTDSIANAALPGWFIDEIRVTVEIVSAIAEHKSLLSPQEFALYQNYPNPFAPTSRANAVSATRILYALPLNAEVELAVFDLMGKRVATLAQGREAAGLHVAEWNGKDERGRSLPSGIYFCRMRAVAETSRSFQLVRRVLLLE